MKAKLDKEAKAEKWGKRFVVKYIIVAKYRFCGKIGDAVAMFIPYNF